MATAGRVLLWTVVLVAPGGFLLVPMLAAASLQGKPHASLRERFAELSQRARALLQRYWTKS
jgi:hypothetical protein